MSKPCLLVVALMAAALFLIGCGGGGAGGLFSIITTSETAGNSTNGTSGTGNRLLYDASWTTQNQSPTGESERVTVLQDGTGPVIATQVINQTSTPQQITFPNVPSGFYRVHVDLYSGPDATGPVTGSLEVQVQGNIEVSTAVGAPVRDLLVTPSTVTMQVGQSRPMSVAGVSDNNVLTFLAPGSVTWSENSAATSVDQTGTVTAVSEGSGQVTASHASGASGTGSVNVVAPGSNRTAWTVMVFLNASNDLYPYAPLDINEMERISTNPEVRFVVQWKQVRGVGGNSNPLFSGTRRYLIQHDTSTAINSEAVQSLSNVDMGTPGALTDFVQWTKQNYPADRYCLIVWNHGNGWHRGFDVVKGVSYDDQTGHAIQAWQLSNAMAGERVDIFSFDACLMQMLEVATELKGTCDYIAASEEDTPGYGYPYDRIFNPFMQNPGASTETLAKAFVDGHVYFPDYQNDTITQSVIDTSKVNGVEQAVDQLGNALINNRSQVASVVQNIRQNALKYAFSGDGRWYYDLWDVANRLQNANTPTAVKNAAQAVKTAVENAVVWEGHTSLSNGSHGIAIDWSPSSDFDSTSYSNLELARSTSWDNWLRVAP